MGGIIYIKPRLMVIDIITVREALNWTCCNLNERQGGGNLNGHMKKGGGDYLNINTRRGDQLIKNMKIGGRLMVCDYVFFRNKYSRKAL